VVVERPLARQSWLDVVPSPDLSKRLALERQLVDQVLNIGIVGIVGIST
jgi:hypothetical protein